MQGELEHSENYRCQECDGEMGCFTAMDREVARPEPGNYVLCVKCATLHQYTEDSVVMLSPEEMRALPEDFKQGLAKLALHIINTKEKTGALAEQVLTREVKPIKKMPPEYYDQVDKMIAVVQRWQRERPFMQLQFKPIDPSTMPISEADRIAMANVLMAAGPDRVGLIAALDEMFIGLWAGNSSTKELLRELNRVVGVGKLATYMQARAAIQLALGSKSPV
jgi:hypothetical protein